MCRVYALEPRPDAERPFPGPHAHAAPPPPSHRSLPLSPLLPPRAHTRRTPTAPPTCIYKCRQSLPLAARVCPRPPPPPSTPRFPPAKTCACRQARAAARTRTHTCVSARDARAKERRHAAPRARADLPNSLRCVRALVALALIRPPSLPPSLPSSIHPSIPPSLHPSLGLPHTRLNPSLLILPSHPKPHPPHPLTLTPTPNP
jgi:hypothetical protein